MLIKYLKAGLNPALFKSIYQLPVMPETLKEWYEWAQKLDWQYRQEQTESKLPGILMQHTNLIRQQEEEVTRGHRHSHWPTL